VGFGNRKGAAVGIKLLISKTGEAGMASAVLCPALENERGMMAGEGTDAKVQWSTKGAGRLRVSLLVSHARSA
jgi:hypothetical protein